MRSRETPARVFGHQQLPEWEALRRIDATRYRRGEPNLFDADLSQSQITELLHRFA